LILMFSSARRSWRREGISL